MASGTPLTTLTSRASAFFVRFPFIVFTAPFVGIIFLMRTPSIMAGVITRTATLVFIGVSAAGFMSAIFAIATFSIRKDHCNDPCLRNIGIRNDANNVGLYLTMRGQIRI